MSGYELEKRRPASAGTHPGCCSTRVCVLWRASWTIPVLSGRARGSSSLIRILGLVASDVDNFECPKCGAHDREQPLLLLEVAGLLSLMLGTRILHFAPERHYERP